MTYKSAIIFDIGGDGDLGETLMYLLDVVFEMRDRK